MPDTPIPLHNRVDKARGQAWMPLEPKELSRLLPNYEVLSLIGRGGMGAVYCAMEKALDRTVALKLLPTELCSQPGFADRFTREARALAKLSHPNIVALHEFGHTSAGHLFFTMEFVEGTTLAELITQSSGLSSTRALSIADQICLALACAHERGVVHRDLKPSNILVDAQGQVKVADFGLARLVDSSEVALGHTVTGLVMGTPDYMAPEQKRGSEVDHRADIYSVGVIFYEMLCRKVPQGAFPPPSKVTGCEAGLDRVVERAMQPEPERRYSSTKEMKADLDAARNSPPQPEGSGVGKWRLAGLSLLVFLMAIGTWWLVSAGPSALLGGQGWQRPANDGLRTVPSGWNDFYDEVARGRLRPEFVVTNADGYLAAEREVHLHLDAPDGGKMRNQVVRMRVSGLVFKIEMRHNGSSAPDARSYSISYDRTTHVIKLHKVVPIRSATLAEGERPRPHGWYQAHDLEIRAIGDRISVFLDGRQIIEKQDTELTRGNIRFYVGAGGIIEKLFWADLGESEAIPPLPGWQEPVSVPSRNPPSLSPDQWRDGIVLFESGVLRAAGFEKQTDGTLVAQTHGASLDLRAPGSPMLEDQVLGVRVRGSGFTLEARRTESDAGGKYFSFGLRYQQDPPLLALQNPWKGDLETQQVTQAPPPGFDWNDFHTLTLAVIGDIVIAWLDGVETLKMKRQGALAGHMAIRADKGTVFEKIEFADLGKSGFPEAGPVETLGGHRYRVVWAHGILWKDAKERAEQLGGHLATISSDEEHEMIARMCAGGIEEMGGGGQFWLGAFNPGTRLQEWQWVTGEPFTFTRWAKGKPTPEPPGAALALFHPPGGVGWNNFLLPNERTEFVGWFIEGYVVEWDR